MGGVSRITSPVSEPAEAADQGEDRKQHDEDACIHGLHARGLLGGSRSETL
jgi:hypothetical protein